MLRSSCLSRGLDGGLPRSIRFFNQGQGASTDRERPETSAKNRGSDLYEVIEEETESGSEGELGLGSGGGESTDGGDSGSSTGSDNTGGRDEGSGSTSSSGKGTTTFTDPGGNVYEIPNP